MRLCIAVLRGMYYWSRSSDEESDAQIVFSAALRMACCQTLNMFSIVALIGLFERDALKFMATWGVAFAAPLVPVNLFLIRRYVADIRGSSGSRSVSAAVAGAKRYFGVSVLLFFLSAAFLWHF